MSGTGPKDFNAIKAAVSAAMSKSNGSSAMDVDSDDDNSDADDENDGNAEVDPVIAKKLADTTLVTLHLDGKIIGWCTAALAHRVAKTLRHWKVQGLHGVPLDMEIGWVPPSKGGQYPGLFMFSTPARMMRPVEYIANGKTDMVGSFEQVYMDIACINEDVVPGVTTHRELHPTSILSVVANLTPFSDFNQSPRNMYQCQMGKQSMGTPAQNFPHRTDNKMYRLQTGQTPIVRPSLYNEYGMDGYPNGMNAVVAVIAYTGYDMEDASIISKSSHERGYGYGTVYKSEFIDLSEKRKSGEPVHLHFGLFGPADKARISPKLLKRVEAFIDTDGLPKVGIKLTDGDPYYAYVDDVDGRVHIVNFKSMEDAYVDEVRLVGADSGDQELQKIHVKLRIPRPPIIGDKFSSRHGQKGVISQKWPAIDMPFSESGIIPDVIINPHAFPSRMTIGMFVESLAGKSGALHGKAQDATPFQFNENHSAADFFGEELKAAGFNYHGNEPMYSGISGREFKADIYIGVSIFLYFFFFFFLIYCICIFWSVECV
jgi:DNA-directed RNA polymerase I subunit RPA2